MIVRRKKSNSTPRRKMYYRGIRCFSRRSGILSLPQDQLKQKRRNHGREQNSCKTIDEYILQFPKEVQEILKTMRKVI